MIEKRIELNQNKINKILVKCRECLEYDRKYDKFKGYVQTNRPGERVGLDAMELIKGQKVMIGIDYFTRKVYGLIIKEKKPENTIKFLEKIKAQIKIEQVVMDNGLEEFYNKPVKSFCESNKIKIKFSIPHVHETNGRVERVNRTIREALKKEKGPLRVKFYKVINTYNNQKHRGLGMTPNEASRKESWNKVIENAKKYQESFEEKKRSKELEIGERVLIRNEIKKNKMDKEFKEEGEIIKILDNNSYKIKRDNERIVTRHNNQLKSLRVM